MPLHLKHRPDKLEYFYGNDIEIEKLSEWLSRKDEDRPHSFFITGPPGTGKTTLARIIKGILGVSDIDFHEYNTSNTRGIDTIREVDYHAKFFPTMGDKRIYFFDESHKLTNEALNAFLKLLEEKKKHNYYILCTAEPETMKGTVKTALMRRCHQIELKKLEIDETIDFLKQICELEGFSENQINKFEKVFMRIAEESEGSPGRALNYLDAVLLYKDDPSTALKSIVHTEEANIQKICRTLLDSRMRPEEKWRDVSGCLSALNLDAESARYAMMGYFKKVISGNSKNKDFAAALGLSLHMTNFMYSGVSGLYFVLYHMCTGDV